MAEPKLFDATCRQLGSDHATRLCIHADNIREARNMAYVEFYRGFGVTADFDTLRVVPRLAVVSPPSEKLNKNNGRG